MMDLTCKAKLTSSDERENKNVQCDIFTLTEINAVNIQEIKTRGPILWIALR